MSSSDPAADSVPAANPEPSTARSANASVPADPETARQYARRTFRQSMLSTGLNLAVLLALVFAGGSAWMEQRVASVAWFAGGPVRLVAGYVLALLLLLTVIGFPFEWIARRTEIHYGLNRQGLGGWWADVAKSFALEIVFGVAAAELVYALLRHAPHTWWLWGWGAFALFAVLLAQLAPVLLMPLFYKFRRLDENDPKERELVRRLVDLCARSGARVKGVFEWKLGEKTSKANAALTGWGSTRRVILSDTLLQQSTPEEIEAVFAHELGHHVHHHIWRGLVFQLSLSLFGFWLAARVLTALGGHLGLHGVADVAGLPLLLLVATLLGFALMPVANGFTRGMERQADDYAFARMGSAQPLISGLERLASQNLAELQPPRWKELLFYSHPAIATRVARGRAWEEEKRRGA